jgi:cell wall integrity and stress response component
MSLRLFTISALLAAARLVSATDQGVEQNATKPVLGTDTVHGCYSSKGSMVLNSTNGFNSQGSCNIACRAMSKNVGATQASDCYCGDEYPPLNLLTTNDKCAEPCPGYGTQACGGLNTWTVYNTGLVVSVAEMANVTVDASASASAGADATAQAAGSTSTVLVTPTPSAGASSGGTSTVGIAVGVVAGILGIAAISGGIFFFMRRRRNADIEEEHRRNAAVNAFISGGKPPSSSGGLSISDQRLDPVMAQRRMSSGSIADDQDYSRRILRVCNPELFPSPSLQEVLWSNSKL